MILVFTRSNSHLIARWFDIGGEYFFFVFARILAQDENSCFRVSAFELVAVCSAFRRVEIVAKNLLAAPLDHENGGEFADFSRIDFDGFVVGDGFFGDLVDIFCVSDDRLC